MGSSIRSFGTALVTVGAAGAGILATVASASERTTGHWHEKGFLALFSLFCLLAAVGVYLLLSTFVRWLPPRGIEDDESGEVPALEATDEGEIELEDSAMSGYPRVGKTGKKGLIRFTRSKINRRDWSD